MMNMWVVRGFIILGVIAAAIGVFMAIKHMGEVEAEARIALADKRALELKWEESFKISSGLEKQLAAERDTNLKLKETLDDEIAKNGVYRTCVVPAVGVRLYNEALIGATAR